MISMEEEEKQKICSLESSFKCDLESEIAECVDQSLVCNGISECLNGRDESVEICGCLPNEFQCNNTHCIDAIRRCDTFADCEDGNDEQDCETHICPENFIKCDNHFCIARYNECNFVDDCGDNSDEIRCKRRECFTTEFRCNNSQCIPMSYLCDQQVDCKDGTDEEPNNCELHFRCPNGLYVNRARVCDGFVDCHFTHLDEAQCGDCPTTQFKCNNNRCIDEANICDGKCDCKSCEDENNCTLASEECEINERYMCKKQHRCIRKEYLCDGHNDCKNTNTGADEYFCSDIKDGCTNFKDAGKHFVCPEGRCLPDSVRCDYYADCLGGEDEENCNFPSCEVDEYQCMNHQCIKQHQRCDGHMDCFDRSDEAHCGNYGCLAHFKKCASGQCIKDSYWCDYWNDCPDNSDELNCSRGECQPGEYRCTNGQCIPQENYCYNGKAGGRHVCSDYSHLLNCSNHQCLPDQFKCRNSYCIDDNQECDGMLDCKMTYWDEHNCPYSCPYKSDLCTCVDEEMDCENRNFTELPSFIDNTLTKFRLSGNNLNASISQDTFKDFPRLTYLDLSNNNLHFLPKRCFESLWRLATLDLRNNHLTEIRNETFIGLSNLRQLYLTGNKIQYIHPDSFVGLSHLRFLDLSNENLHILPQNAFVGLRNVFNLNLSRNHIQFINDGAFNGLKNLYLLDISHNDVDMIQENVFHGIPKLKTLYTDEFRFCCLVATMVDQCYPEPDEFSSCQNLMSNYILRITIWILGMVAGFGNLLVIGWRARDLRGGKVHSFLITNLAIGDFFMGVYLLIIAVVDSYYRGVYISYDKTWRQSSLCHFAGFISTFSSELSVFTLTVITLDRLICILFPLKMRRLCLKEAMFVMACVWLVVFIMAVIPLIGLDYFTNFYGRSGVCLAFHITPSSPPGWEYSVAVFLVLNFVSFLVIFLSYFWMFIVAKRTRSAVRATETKTDAAMARRMTLIVMTDFFCWVPIILLGYASLGGASIPKQVYAWVAVFVLPLNSAINPVLYTISTAPFLGNVKRRAYRFRKSFMNSFTMETKNTFIDERTTTSWDRKSPYRHMDLIRMRGLDRSPVHSQSDQSDY
ncbi:hypothetical protein SNE40_021407 [Patella caerulea]|uniref:G-protein coupled receptors family 1 profile domain-containing protein n=1 Tax=Patella caerulea TaxID=87958 RepID=A0AAN8J497_PATCE